MGAGGARPRRADGDPGVDELGWGAVVLRSLVSKLPLERGRLDDSLTLFQFGQITFMPLHRAAHHGLDGLAADRVFQVLLSPADHLAQRVVQALLDLRGEPAVGGELAQWLQPAACGHQQRPELGGVAGDTRSQACRAEISIEMTAREIAEAQRQARAWLGQAGHQRYAA